MAVTIVQSKSAGGTDATPKVTLDSTPTDGNLLVGCCFSGAAGLTDPTNWSTAVNIHNVTENDDVRISYRIASGETTTVQYSQAGSLAWTVIVYELSVSGGWNGTPVDQTASTGRTVSATSLSSGTTAALAQSDDYAVAFWGLRTLVTNEAVDSGFTLQTVQSGAGTFDSFVGVKELTNAAAVSCTGSWTTAATAMACIATFKPASTSSSLSVSVSDNISALDEQAGGSWFGQIIIAAPGPPEVPGADSVTVSESVTLFFNPWNVVVSDSITVTDVAPMQIGQQANPVVQDSISVSEIQTVRVSGAPQAFDSVTLVDSDYAHDVTLTWSTGSSDPDPRYTNYQAGIVDAAGHTQTVIVALATTSTTFNNVPKGFYNDFARLSNATGDLLGPGSTGFFLVTDLPTIDLTGDTVTADLVLVSESVSVGISTGSAINAVGIDSITDTEFVSIKAPLPAGVADTITVSEGIQIAGIPLLLSAGDDITVSEGTGFAIVTVGPPQVFDAILVSELVTIQINPINCVVFDAIAVNEGGAISTNGGTIAFPGPGASYGRPMLLPVPLAALPTSG